VGATALLSEGRRECLAVDLRQPADALAHEVAPMLSDAALLLSVSRAACTTARAYDEASNAERLLDVLRPHLPRAGTIELSS